MTKPKFLKLAGDSLLITNHIKKMFQGRAIPCICVFILLRVSVTYNLYKKQTITQIRTRIWDIWGFFFNEKSIGNKTVVF